MSRPGSRTSSHAGGSLAGVRRFLGENLGFSGARNIAAWTVAGVVAYSLWVKPQKQAAEERKAAQVAARQHAVEKGLIETDKASPLPDPQLTGLQRGSKKQP
ncbi:hypothetical protein WJX84_001381 [Apatococcus fuscideae]|uniref:Uncharacterized protein n=1 Tax=Apatococcus fuscideae TaxID=2026836 RepID=A0AAW1SLK7_9CHLO